MSRCVFICLKRWSTEWQAVQNFGRAVDYFHIHSGILSTSSTDTSSVSEEMPRAIASAKSYIRLWVEQLQYQLLHKNWRLSQYFGCLSQPICIRYSMILDISPSAFWLGQFDRRFEYQSICILDIRPSTFWISVHLHFDYQSIDLHSRYQSISILIISSSVFWLSIHRYLDISPSLFWMSVRRYLDTSSSTSIFWISGYRHSGRFHSYIVTIQTM